MSRRRCSCASDPARRPCERCEARVAELEDARAYPDPEREEDALEAMERAYERQLGL